MSPPCSHAGEAIGVYGGGPSTRPRRERRNGYQGIDCRKGRGHGHRLDESQTSSIKPIPPAYTEHIGGYLKTFPETSDREEVIP